MTFDQLTPEQQAILLHYVDQLLRPVIGEFARLLNHMEAADYDYDGQSSAILALLSAGQTVPNQSGLAGTATLTKENVQTFANAMNTILTTYNTAANRQLMVQIAGAENTIG